MSRAARGPAPPRLTVAPSPDVEIFANAKTMTPLRILAAATAIELCVFVGLAAVAGLGGPGGGILDLINSAAPMLLAMALLGAFLAQITLEAGPFRMACISLALAAAVFNLVLLAPDALGFVSEPRGPSEGRPYRVVTANLFRDNYVPEHAVATLLGRHADALLLEETDGSAGIALGEIDRAYPNATRCPLAGLTIWTRGPILDQGCGLGTPPGDEKTWGRSFAWASTIGPDGRPIILAVVHLGRPSEASRQVWERAALARAMARFPGARVVLAGDFNTAPWTFGMFRQDQLLRPLRRISRFMPTYPALIAHNRWDWPWLPIDHVYIGSAWRPAGLSRFRTNGSDHSGLQADLVLRGEG